jgi:hypothetical protein
LRAEQPRPSGLALFAKAAMLADDGNEREVIEWSDHDLFGDSHTYVAAINRVEDGVERFMRSSTPNNG